MKKLICMLLGWLPLFGMDIKPLTLTSLKGKFKDIPLSVSQQEHPYDRLNLNKTSPVTFEEFTGLMNAFAWGRKAKNKNKKWVACNKKNEVFKLGDDLFDLQNNKFAAFIEKKVCDPNMKVHFKGDIHGDLASVLKTLQEFKEQNIIDEDLEVAPGNMIVFQGDCNDSGANSVEVWYTLLHFANKNPETVVILRGNHETKVEFERWFAKELAAKFGNARKQELVNQLQNMYRLLPVAFFLGCKEPFTNYISFICASHAALEVGYQGYHQLLADDSDDACQMLHYINRVEQIKKIPSAMKSKIYELAQDRASLNEEIELGKVKELQISDIEACEMRLEGKDRRLKAFYHLGFCCDYYLDDPTKSIDYDEGRNVWRWGKEFTESVLNLWRNDTTYRKFLMYLNWPLRKLFSFGFNGPTYSVMGNIRSHQHEFHPESEFFPFMKTLIRSDGLHKMWASKEDQCKVIWGSVFTTLCAPDNIYGYPKWLGQLTKNPKPKYLVPFDFATITTLTLGAALSDWKIKPEKIRIFSKEDIHEQYRDNIVGLEALD